MTEKDNIVKECGRIRYIEPNNLFTTSKGDKVQNTIPQPYEDYSLSVNLRVINGNRYDCGLTDEGDDIVNRVLEFSSDKGTLSFLDGTAVNGGQGYLTTNFTDISMNNPETNTKECLGIESISIKYDSWYTPTVDIKFTDVRGASLMLPAEYEYYNNGGSNVGKNKATTNSEFFKAFFSFPYPLFKLSIKGFYGKEVTYDLSVTKCNIDFNSSNGNFEIFASFIGYMYGMYADIPFSFLYLAPYIDLYGKNTWDEKATKTGDFRYLTSDKKNPHGREMYTFPELKHAIEDAGKNIDAEQGNSESGKCRTEGNELLKKINNEVLAYYPLGQSAWWSWSKTEKGAGYFFLIAEDENKTNRKIFEDFNKYTKSLLEYNELAAKSENKYKNFKDKTIECKSVFENVYNRTNEVGKNGKKEFSDEDIKNILKGQVVTLRFTKNTEVKDKPTLTFEVEKSDFGGTAQSKFQPLINELKTRFSKNEHNTPMSPNSVVKEWSIKALYIDDIKYRNVIVDTHNDINKTTTKLANDLAKQRETKIEQTIGFTPSMKNIFNMLFAHTDTFMTTFYNTLERIRKSIISSSDESRKKETLCGSDGHIQVDVNENTLKSASSNGGKLPPFTMFYKEETEKDSKERKVTMVWPGSIVGGEKLDEVKLVEAIINASALNKRRYESVTEKHNIVDRRGNLVPITYYDIENKDKNPYLDVITRNSLTDNKNLVSDIIKVFMARCYYVFLNGNYLKGEDDSASNVTNATRKARLIAELEVGNIVRAFQILGTKPTNAFLNQLLLNDLNFEGINSKGHLFSQTGTDVKYTQITSGETSYLPVGDFTPTTISNAQKVGIPEASYDKFILLKDGVAKSSASCKIHCGGNYIEDVLAINGTGDFIKATKLFSTYKKLPSSIADIGFCDSAFINTLVGDALKYSDSYKSIKTLYDRKNITDLIKGIPDLPSFRRSEAGVTNIFMDPLYYAQTSREARAYLFLFGVPYGKNKDFFLPENIENGDYPTLMLLREGALWWRYNTQVNTTGKDDPIVYSYIINGTEINWLNDIEDNDPCLGRKRYVEYYTGNTTSQARKDAALNYFLAWVNGDLNDENNTYKVFPSVSFQEIERYFALWGYTTKDEKVTRQVLSYFGNEGVLASLKKEYVKNFANGDVLREVYDVTKNGKLGEITGNLRINVFINPGAILENYVLTNTISKQTNDFMQRFRNFYVGFDTIIDYTTFDKPNKEFGVSKDTMVNAVNYFVDGLKSEYKEATKDLKEATGTTSEGEIEDRPEDVEYFNDNDLKLACYIALKNLYDRWLCSRKRETWTFSCDADKMANVNSDFLRFYYIDEFYHNIGLTIRPNLTNFIETVSKLGGFTEKSDETDLMSRSLLKIMSTTAQYGGCSLLTLPTALGMGKTDSTTGTLNSIADVFRAFPYNDAVKTNSIETSFIILYSSEKSSVLNIENKSGTMAYKSDSFDIADTWGEIDKETIKLFEGNPDDDDYAVPAFGVTFAKQNQSYFTNINLSMNDHQVTEYSLRTELMISYENNKGPRETSMVGQDLYSVFSNYSYSCNVEMLGDAQITPLMYFQLNNIPMWKGAYLITNVHHDISYQGMNTVFTGVRQARPTLPFKDNKLALAASDIEKNTPQSQNETDGHKNPNNSIDMSEMPLSRINIDDIKGVYFSLQRDSLSTDEKYINGILVAQVWYNDDLEKDTDFITLARTKEQITESQTPMIQGRYNQISVFTDAVGKHIVINDNSILGNSFCEITFDDKMTLSNKVSPIVIYESETINGEIDMDMINAIYDDMFNFIENMTEAKKGISFSVLESKDMNDKKMDI